MEEPSTGRTWRWTSRKEREGGGRMLRFLVHAVAGWLDGLQGTGLEDTSPFCIHTQKIVCCVDQSAGHRAAQGKVWQ